MTTVIIPAHNEESEIARCLSALRPAERPAELQVVVICNGCSDATAAVANSFENVSVIETGASSKTAALNLGDRAARSYPRVYLDADIELPREIVDELAAQLERTGLPAATVSFRLDMSSASKGVVRHYRARARAPYPDHLIGRGVFCLSEEGRSRFSDFPPVISDDLFVQSLFAREECLTVETFSAVVRPPATVRELIRVQSRVAAGNREHLELYPDRSQQGSRSALIRANLQPSRWLDLATFLFVVGMSRLLPRLRVNDRHARWETSRPAAPSAPADQGQRITTRHLGMPLSLLTWSGLEQWVTTAVARQEGATVCTLAPYQAYLWRTDPLYASALSRASVVLVDGNGVRLALSLAGLRSEGRLTGREVVRRIFDGELAAGARVALIGSSPASQQVLGKRRPDWLVLGGRYPSEPEPMTVAKIATALEAHSIEVVLVALGCPKQELWADALARHHPSVYFSIGGAVDTVAGTRLPPPQVVERLGLEWAWRLAQDPALLDHVLRAAQTMPALLGKAISERFGRSKRRALCEKPSHRETAVPKD
ncbi:MAG: WecB/TagA/CpsF family glycosyltransferase [Acidimicrobiales bacterium]|jgi:exopolysaccharide biosynthesis WecB/TagA/CpsF family protein